MYFPLLIVSSLIIFVASEKTFLHFRYVPSKKVIYFGPKRNPAYSHLPLSIFNHSRTARRAFWYILSCALGLLLVRWLRTIEGLGMVWVFLSAVLAASVVEDEMVKRSGLTPMNIEATQELRFAYRSPEAQGKAERLMDIVGAITRGKGITAGTKQVYSRISGATVRNQRSMNTLLEESSPQEVNFILCSVNAAALVDVLHDSTMDMLTTRRLMDLSTVSRAVLVDALQKIGMRYRPKRQEWVRDIMIATRGLDLTHLKAYIDDGGDYHTMYKLMYHDLQGSIQAAVADHISKEGKALVAEYAQICPGASGVNLKVLSDIDDTLFSSGGSFPAGVDTRFPRKCYYPGVLALFAELDRSFAKKHRHTLAVLREETRELEFPVLGGGRGGGGGAAAAGLPPRSPSKQASSIGGFSRSPSPLQNKQFAALSSFTSGHLHTINNNSNQPQTGATAGPGGPSGNSSNPSPPESTGGEEEEDAATATVTAAAGGDSGRTSPQQSPPGGFKLPPIQVNSHSSGEGIAPATAIPAQQQQLTAAATAAVGVAGSGASGLLSRLSTPRAPGTCTPTGGSPRAGMAPAWGGPWQEANASTEPHQEGSNLVFLSARPESYKGLTESEAYRKYFQPLVQRGELDTSPTMLLGSLDSGPKAMFKIIHMKGMRWWKSSVAEMRSAKTVLYQTLGVKKLSRFREYAAIFPECCFIFVGDNGQGDVMAAEILSGSMKKCYALGMGRSTGNQDKSSTGANTTTTGGGVGVLPPTLSLPTPLLTSLIHQVRPIEETLSIKKNIKPRSKSSGSAAATWKERRITFHETHVGMAVYAYEKDLLSQESLHRVAVAAVNDFRRIWGRYGGRYAGRYLGMSLNQLNNDLMRASILLPEHLKVPPLRIPGLMGGGGGGGGGEKDDDEDGGWKWFTKANATMKMPPPSPARSEAGSDVSGFLVEKSWKAA